MLDKTFMEITNKDLFDKLEHLVEKLEVFDKKNDAAHFDIILRQNQTNGRVKLNRWISTTALSLVFLSFGMFATHLMQCID